MSYETETAPAQRQTLAFERDAGAGRSSWIAAGLLAAIVAWMGSGFLREPEAPAVALTANSEPVIAVSTRASVARQVVLDFTAEGVARPDRDTVILAEAAGPVTSVLVAKGADVTEGEVIARLDTSRAEADLRRAREVLEQARREHDNANALLERGVATTDRLVEARSALAAAEAGLVSARETLADNIIVAPFAGRVETLEVAAGEYLSVGAEVARIVDNQPLIVAFQVPQQSLPLIDAGETAHVSLITGEEAAGIVTFVGTSAAAETRTFLAEVEMANADGAIAAGISAEIQIPVDDVLAHHVSPAVLSLDPSGETGVKVVETGRAVFYPIQAVRSDPEGLWVTGLPEEAEIITIGQGFVQAGDRVDARPQSAETR